VPVSPTYPGVYINELPSAVHTIVGVPTSVAAFVGAAPRGATDTPVQLNSFGDYLNEFGRLDSAVPLSYAVYLFFQNGGTTALCVRVGDPTATAAELELAPGLKLLASSPGSWGNSLTAVVDTSNLLNPKVNAFNLTLSDDSGNAEEYRGVSMSPGPLFVKTLLLASALVNPDPSNTYATAPTADTYGVAPAPTPATTTAPSTPAAGDAPAGGTATTPADTPASDPGPTPTPTPAVAGTTAPETTPKVNTTGSTRGVDGTSAPTLGDTTKTGIWALKTADIFNMLCLPCVPSATFPTAQTLSDAADFCTQQRAMLIVDTPFGWTDTPLPLSFPHVVANPALEASSANAAVYYPNLVIQDTDGSTFELGASAAMAGVWANTDATRGVWKAPAGTSATVTGITGLSVDIDDGESGTLNPIAVNCLRTLPLIGPVSWGARTTRGADQLTDQWKYIPVRRTALYIEESLRRGTQWVVFEPNDEPLWSAIRLNVGTFMNTMFRQGAFQGSTPTDAYLVRCDASNNPQATIDQGIVNILVGFAPLQPAEFVIINIEQLAGQA
jgi:phage tail sheath protein FI